MTAIDQSEALRQEAISLLLADRNAIDTQLAKLGFDGTTETQPKKDRKPKTCGRCGVEGHTQRTCSVTQSI